MAAKKSTKARAGSTAAPKKRTYHRSRSSSSTRTASKKGIFKGIGSKIKWGEAALFAALGYEMGNVFQGTGIPEYFYQKYPDFAYAVNGSTAKDSGDFINKVLGAGAGAKVLYDGAEGKVSENDMSVMLPYTLGTVFDANKHKSVSNGERW